MRLRTREEIQASGFGHLYHFCPSCADHSAEPGTRPTSEDKTGH